MALSHPVAEALLAAHLDRLLLASGISIVVGAGLALRPEPVRIGGGMTVGWALVNILIALPGKLNPGVSDPMNLRDVLAVNCGLNVAYIAVAITLMILGKPRAKSAGAAVLVQGLILFVLDAVLFGQIVRQWAEVSRPG
ncbi:MAG: hypothetical protein SFX74_02750 [Fimbriimonadaceae bacterium]|nr:hypothetical protein [Fimbriimonadaceae bacterium]